MDFFPIRSGIDLRAELHAILFGRSDIVPQGRQVVIRRMTDTHCVCWDGVTGGPKLPCPYCQGEGYLFTEDIQTVFIISGIAPLYKGGFLGTGEFPFTATGFDDPNKATAYCEYNVFPNYERYNNRSDKYYDKVYELKVNPDGSTLYPLTRAGKWKLLNVTPVHGDFGRVEYFILGLDKEFI
jgi:hypothetical protein